MAQIAENAYGEDVEARLERLDVLGPEHVLEDRQQVRARQQRARVLQRPVQRARAAPLVREEVVERRDCGQQALRLLHGRRQVRVRQVPCVRVALRRVELERAHCETQRELRLLERAVLRVPARPAAGSLVYAREQNRAIRVCVCARACVRFRVRVRVRVAVCNGLLVRAASERLERRGDAIDVARREQHERAGGDGAPPEHERGRVAHELAERAVPQVAPEMLASPGLQQHADARARRTGIGIGTCSSTGVEHKQLRSYDTNFS